MASKRDKKWDEKFKELEDHKKEHGDCNIPSRYAPNPSLGQWVAKQRKLLKKGRLLDERKRRLGESGFALDDVTRNTSVYDKNWEQKFKELEEYKIKYGDCNVPQGYADNPSLGGWVLWQRKLKRNGRLSDDRRRRLEEVGFVFGLRVRKDWGVRFRAAKEYKDKHGRWPTRGHPELGNWVNEQRRQHTKGELLKERTDLLNDAGFRWDVRRPPCRVPGDAGDAAADTGHEAAPSKGRDFDIEREGGSVDETVPSAATKISRSGGVDYNGLDPTARMSEASEREKACQARVERVNKRLRFREEKARAEDHASGDAANKSIADPCIGWEGADAGEGRLGAGGSVSGSLSTNEQKTACLWEQLEYSEKVNPLLGRGQKGS